MSINQQQQSLSMHQSPMIHKLHSPSITPPPTSTSNSIQTNAHRKLFPTMDHHLNAQNNDIMLMNDQSYSKYKIINLKEIKKKNTTI